MYALTIIETDTYRQALIVRAIMEGAGFPTVASQVELHDGSPTVYAALTSAPRGAAELAAPIVLAYDSMGDRGLERVRDVASRSPKSTRAIPEAQRDEVRNALLHTLYTAADEQHATVTSEPAHSVLAPTATENHDPGDEHNPKGGGFDGECVDKYDQWKPNRDIAAGVDW